MNVAVSTTHPHSDSAFTLFSLSSFYHISAARTLSKSLYNMSEPLMFKGTLAGHSGWVTAIATSPENPDMILTASRGEFEAFPRKYGRYTDPCL